MAKKWIIGIWLVPFFFLTCSVFATTKTFSIDIDSFHDPLHAAAIGLRTGDVISGIISIPRSPLDYPGAGESFDIGDITESRFVPYHPGVFHNPYAYSLYWRSGGTTFDGKTVFIDLYDYFHRDRVTLLLGWGPFLFADGILSGISDINHSHTDVEKGGAPNPEPTTLFLLGIGILTAAGICRMKYPK